MAQVKLPVPEKAIYDKGRKKGREEGKIEGYEKGKSDYRITYPCWKCNKPIEILPIADSHVALVQYLRENGWGHASCL